MGRPPVLQLFGLLVLSRQVRRVVSAVTVPQTPSGITCPGPNWHPVGDRCYLLSGTEHTFEACQRDVCGKAHGTLACLRHDASSVLSKLGIGLSEDFFAAWFGLTDAGHEGNWTWVNGCGSKTNSWAWGEPNNYCGGEDCAAVTGGFRVWADISCRLRLPCICEYPGEVTAEYNRSVFALRDDTCYSNCPGTTEWCSAWPFTQLYDVDDDLCHWEEASVAQRGRGAGECVHRAAQHDFCGPYISYAVGRCKCSPVQGKHANCSHRVKDATSDIFVLEAKGARLVHSGYRCFYSQAVDDDYFYNLRPATSGSAAFWIYWRAAFIWLVFGIPCGAIMIYATCRLCCRCKRADGSVFDDGDQLPAADLVGYGPLLESGGGDDSTATADAVNRWIFRGAFGAIIYGIALLALGATLAVHMAGTETAVSLEGLEVVESFLLAVSKATVARAACMVHCRLSQTARETAGPWVLVFGTAKWLMVVSAIIGVSTFMTIAERDFESVCLAIYLFRWSLLLALPLQCVSGFALWRIKVRAEPYAQGEASVGGWVTALVLGNFGSGAAVWWAGYLGAVHEADTAMGGCFIIAAVAQLVAGVSLMLVNRKIKQYFRMRAQQQDAAPASEVAPTQLGCTEQEDI